jgi:hypothetical protein
MNDSKKVTIVRAGGTASVEVDIFPTDKDIGQFCTVVAPHLGLPPDGSYQLLGPDGNPIQGDLYKAVRQGDKLTLAQLGQGGYNI